MFFENGLITPVEHTACLLLASAATLAVQGAVMRKWGIPPSATKNLVKGASLTLLIPLAVAAFFARAHGIPDNENFRLMWVGAVYTAQDSTAIILHRHLLERRTLIHHLCVCLSWVLFASNALTGLWANIIWLCACMVPTGVVNVYIGIRVIRRARPESKPTLSECAWARAALTVYLPCYITSVILQIVGLWTSPCSTCSEFYKLIDVVYVVICLAVYYDDIYLLRHLIRASNLRAIIVSGNNNSNSGNNGNNGSVRPPPCRTSHCGSYDFREEFMEGGVSTSGSTSGSTGSSEDSSEGSVSPRRRLFEKKGV